MPIEAKTADSENYDIVIIGGGPAGSSTATFLAQKGWQVLLLEREKHPRFHIGESLLPMTLPLLKELGVFDKIKAIGTPKYGAEFNSQSEDNPLETFYFSGSLDKEHPQAFQVLRSQFDEILFRNLSANNVAAYESCKVTSVAFQENDSVLLSYTDDNQSEHQIKSRFLIDASGRDTFISRKLKLKQKSKKHNSAAIFGHFQKVERRSGNDAGNISIYWFEHGWFWLIPLQNGIMSVGAVCYPNYLKQRRGSLAEFLQESIKLVPEVQQRMQNAEVVGEIQATGNFTYTSTRMYGKPGENYLLVGDAYAFIDPVFSSGVHIAMSGAKLAAECVDELLRDPANRTKALNSYSDRINAALNTFSWLIHRFNSPVMQKIFMAPGNNFQIKEAIISLLAGDLYRNTPIKLRLNMFKAIYYFMFCLNFPKAWVNYRRRKRNIATELTATSEVLEKKPSED